LRFDERAGSSGKGVSALCRKANEAEKTRNGSRPKSGQSADEDEAESGINGAERACANNER
jgi:hypothetical protein